MIPDRGIFSKNNEVLHFSYTVVKPYNRRMGEQNMLTGMLGAETHSTRIHMPMTDLLWTFFLYGNHKGTIW